MLNNVDGASPEKTKKRKRRTQAKILKRNLQKKTKIIDDDERATGKKLKN